MFAWLKRTFDCGIFGHDWNKGAIFEKTLNLPIGWEATCSCGYTMESVSRKQIAVFIGYKKRKPGIWIDGELKDWRTVAELI